MLKQKYDLLMLGKRIQRLRGSQGLSIEGLASKARVNKNTIVRLEKAEKGVSFDTVLKICEALDISIGKLIEDKPTEDIDYKIAYGYRQDRKTISEGPVTIGDINIHLEGGSLHAGILEIKGNGIKRSHPGEELLFCLTGSVEVDVNGKKITLKKGDCIVFWGAEPHSYSYLESKKGRDEAVCLSVLASNEQKKLEDFLTHNDTQRSIELLG